MARRMMAVSPVVVNEINGFEAYRAIPSEPVNGIIMVAVTASGQLADDDSDAIRSYT